jgi:hypothetical protein
MGDHSTLANLQRDFEGMALPLRTTALFVPSREARVYNCLVGPGVPSFYAVSCDGRRSIGVMTGRTNWSRIKQRSLMRRRGVEDIKGDTPIVTPPANKQPRPRKLSKAELREQAAAAFLAWRAGQTSKNK